MGRNYYCEYCDKIMKNDLNVRKKHNEGLPHSIAKAEFLQRIKDPQQILNEESCKKPCGRFSNGKECRFGLLCHFSHYSQIQLDELKYMIMESEVKKQQKKNTKRKYFVRNENNFIEERPINEAQWKFWNYSYLNTIHPYYLPPSIQPIILEKIPSELPQWGS